MRIIILDFLKFPTDIVLGYVELFIFAGLMWGLVYVVKKILEVCKVNYDKWKWCIPVSIFVLWTIIASICLKSLPSGVMYAIALTAIETFYHEICKSIWSLVLKVIEWIKGKLSK